ncbi:hypothetical protein COCC4DRAFT_18574 [Bipolaris maydis ATCC 48331]|uniref:Rhodopsin domain-containing protein n=2 Tax=Cochliobolus heterostrophus TaxID=5016 RepID=M2TDV3_COCH5|nr:uncharacterized protein COCC4DRAFT_18574 [Bipolaris maydis ATCC 48331]EMD95655.1 hypothetical protein COCHEDRAFT_1026496 [Bipolaris maydis C5]KAH7561584.1 hypothetical protein BM1_02688 [Bipolaris maydis]ENI10515.1 hypothetical protein COCC4DRAFT_18574 [Bipolaris maydis ATCC 48331]KAJ5030392.1 hypothetical protein J3E73DRAFT_404744 [Bipolaris maydis]KAJ5065403.1 hypothetical protein J3E74DRAFT_435152 [Bipolaris maydis]
MTAVIDIPMARSGRDSMIAMSCLWLLAASTVVFRIYGRIKGPGLSLDDIFAGIAMVLTTSTIGLNAEVFTSGVGYDFDPNNAEMFPKLMNNLPHIMQLTFAYTLIYIWCLAALKLSQLALYHRVFVLQLRIAVYIVGGIVVAWAIIFNFVFLFLCDPISQQWTVERVGHCLDQMLLLKFLILTNMITDLMIVVLPIRAIWQLQMRKTEKFAVLACFGLGLACVFIGIARFVLIYTIDLIGNLTGTSGTTFMLCTVELMLASLCINIPMLRPFYLRWRSHYKSSSMDSSGLKSGPKRSPTGGLGGSQQQRPGHYTQWMELHDKDTVNATVTGDDASSERKLTADPMPFDAIQVSKDFTITRD